MVIVNRTAAAMACLASFAAPDIGHAQFKEQTGYDPALTAPEDAAEVYQKSLEAFFTANPVLSFNVRNYDSSLCSQVISQVDIPNPDDGNDWPASARLCLGEHGAIVSASYPATAIVFNSIKEDAQGNIEAAVQFADVNGGRIKPNAIAVYDLDKRRVASNVDGFASTATEVNYHFLVDRSGSMTSVSDDVRRSVSRFAQRLPNSRDCLLYSFATDFVAHSGKDCQSIGNVMNTIKFGGSTNLYTALDDLFSRIPKAGSKSDRFDVVLVFSDGVPTDSPALKAKVQTAKTAPLFVYWMGGYDKDALAGVVDYEAAANQGIGSVSMDTFLGEIGVSVEEQFVIRFEKPQ